MAEARFVVQRHRARRLHYDLRLELAGTPVSWAVPKGPTLDPQVSRLAVRVGDHDLSHLSYEGTTGASTRDGTGDTIVWDTGTWRSTDDDPAAVLAAGRVHAELSGHKLVGGFVLIRTDEGDDPERGQWLLRHRDDRHAVTGWDPEDFPRSVLSGLTNDEISATGPGDVAGGGGGDDNRTPRH